ncbi:MAG: hypothetical protein L6R41_001250 [Letrouitia leprolyta]|nr:MAG: hypothetical protein L6R41_001250 [Letrouitia leprolyta]
MYLLKLLSVCLPPLLSFPILSLSQKIAPTTPSNDLRFRQEQQTPSPTEKPARTSIDYWSAIGICLSIAPCTSHIALNDACEAEYNGDFKYLYCLCTTGYYDQLTECDACSVSLGIGFSQGSQYYASMASWYRSDCSRYAVQYSGDVITGTGTGIMGGAGLGNGLASATGARSASSGGGGGSTTSEDRDLGGLVKTLLANYLSNPTGVASRISSTRSDVPFGGLVDTGSAGSTNIVTATATGSESIAGRMYGVQGSMLPFLTILMVSWAVLF